MSDKKISELTAAGTLDGSEKIACVKGGETVYLTPNQIIAEIVADLLADKYDVSNPNNYIPLSAVTAAVVTAKVLTGLSISGSVVVSTDTILDAIGKLQNQVNAVAGGVNYQGTWNASTNSPSITGGSGTKGHYRVVSTPGSTSIDGTNEWKLGDWIIYNGTAWQKVDNTDAVISVNGYTGIVTLAIGDIPDLQEELDDKALIMQHRTGTHIKFDREAIYGSPDVPETGNITVDGTGFVSGLSVEMVHNASDAPEFGAGDGSDFKLIGGEYVPDVNNFIVFQAWDADLVHYWIYQQPA